MIRIQFIKFVAEDLAALGICVTHLYSAQAEERKKEKERGERELWTEGDDVTFPFCFLFPEEELVSFRGLIACPTWAYFCSAIRNARSSAVPRLYQNARSKDPVFGFQVSGVLSIATLLGRARGEWPRSQDVQLNLPPRGLPGRDGSCARSVPVTSADLPRCPHDACLAFRQPLRLTPQVWPT